VSDARSATAAFLDAVRRGVLPEVHALLDRDPKLIGATASADPESPRSGGSTALHLAARHGHSGLVYELVRRGADLEAATAEGRTALHDAIEYGQFDTVRTLLDLGARVDICAAAILGRLDDVRAMLAADPSLANDRSTSLSPLGWASFGNQVEVAKALIEAGARMDDGELLCAAMVGQAEVGRLLLDHGADPNALEPGPGANALHAAATLRYTTDASRFVQMLLEAGADPSIRTRDGRTALNIAEEGARAQAAQGRGGLGARNFAGIIGLLRAASA